MWKLSGISFCGLKSTSKSIIWILTKWNIEKQPILWTHLLFKITLAAEPYPTIKIDAKLMTYIAKFMVIFHRLAKETSRHQKTPLPIVSRVSVYIPCEIVDDELHVVTIWEYHDVERARLYKIAKCYIVDFESLDNRAKIIVILGSSILVVALGNFLQTCFRKREIWR